MLKEAFLGSVTGTWDCSSVWGDTPEAPQEVAPSQPSGRAPPWGDWASQIAQGASPGCWERAAPRRFSLAWVREEREG